MKIIRVFPTITSMTPVDNYVFQEPEIFIPEHDEVHISTTFTWDIEYARFLVYQWEGVTKKPVKLGGPAFGDRGNGFKPGTYLKKGVTITSRGCNRGCAFCLVPKREGKIRELPIKVGNIIQDNNILACSDRHINKVFEMLKTQKKIQFKGGLKSQRITPKIAEKLRGLKISELWLACDYPQAPKPLRKAVNILKRAGFRRDHIRVYVLIGKDMAEEESRLREVYNMGTLPFAQLFQPSEPIEYSKKWKDFNRTWSRPAAYKTLMKSSP